MTRRFNVCIRLLVVTVGLVWLAGCSSMRPIASTPPKSRLVITQQFNAMVGFRNAVFPSGEYQPLYEDKGGYYYQAPGKVVEQGLLANHLCDGGLYIKRGNMDPTQWYVIEETGSTFFGPLREKTAAAIVKP